MTKKLATLHMFCQICGKMRVRCDAKKAWQVADDHTKKHGKDHHIYYITSK